MASQSVVQLFFNPASGSYSPRRLKALAGALRAEGAQVIATPSIDSAPVVAEQATHICIAGGDGTVRHVAMNLARSGRVLPTAIYPAGTVNLLAREGHFQRSPAACAHELLHGDLGRPHHPVALGETMFFACASAGPDSAAVARVSPALKRRIGRLAYVVAFLQVLRDWPRPRLRLTANGRVLDCEAVYIAKGRYFAGPWSFAPRARVSERLLHVVALPTARRRDYLGFLWTMLLRRDPGRSRWAVSFTCTDLTLHGEDAFPVQADGDVVAFCPVDLTLQAAPIHFR
jgi:diacylglycerol kinase family enzyme